MNLYKKVDAHQFAYEDWVDGTELCLGRHHNYVPVEPDYEAAFKRNEEMSEPMSREEIIEMVNLVWVEARGGQHTMSNDWAVQVVVIAPSDNDDYIINVAHGLTESEAYELAEKLGKDSTP